jgi:hypothetical protein
MSMVTLSNQDVTHGMAGYDRRGSAMSQAKSALRTAKKTSAQRLQSFVANLQAAQVLERIHYVLAAAAKLALALVDQTEDILCRQVARILGVGTVDHKGERFDRFCKARDRDRLENLEINIRNLFPLAEIGDRFSPPRLGNLKHNAPARPTSVQPKDEAWHLWCTSVLMRIDAETAMETLQRARALTQGLETWSPHQRAIAEHPAIAAQTVNPSSSRVQNLVPLYPARPRQSPASHPVPA